MSRENLDLKNLLLDEEIKELIAYGQKGYNTKEVYEWEADYREGKKTYTKDVEPIVKKEVKWYDDTLRPLPNTLWLDCKDYDNDDTDWKMGSSYVLSPNYIFIGAIGYHFLTKALPLWLFIMLYW